MTPTQMEEIQILADWELYFSKLWINMKDCDLTTEDGKKEFARTILMEVHSNAMMAKLITGKNMEQFGSITTWMQQTTELMGRHNDALKEIYDVLKK